MKYSIDFFLGTIFSYPLNTVRTVYKLTKLDKIFSVIMRVIFVAKKIIYGKRMRVYYYYFVVSVCVCTSGDMVNTEQLQKSYSNGVVPVSQLLVA
jgi:hypothetical protein